MILLLLAAAHAATLRATVRADGDALSLVDAVVVEGTAHRRRPGSGPQLEVLDPTGSVIAAAAVPDPRWRSIIGPEGGGDVLRLAASLGVVTIPWPDGAQAVRLGSTTVTPRRAARGAKAGATLEVVQEAGDPAERLDLVFLGDGYTAAELEAFAADVDRMVAYVLSIEPYGAYTGLFNIWRVDQASAESGASHYETTPATTRDTAYGCYYGCGGITRLICCNNTAVVRTVGDLVPDADGIMVLVNDSQYGGSGGWTYATSYNGEAYGHQVVAHELGHSLVGLWDEYSYGYTYAGSDGPNCGQDPGDLPWEHWLGEYGVDAYETCSYTNFYRPTSSDCMMNSLQDDYCVVCREQAVREIYAALPGLVTDVEPAEGEVVGSVDETLLFTAELLGPDAGPTATWTFAGADVGSGSALELPGCGESGELVLAVADETEWVRQDPEGLLTDEASWQVVREPCPPEPEDSGDDSGATADTGRPTAPPGARPTDEVSACGCHAASPAAPWLLLLLPALARRRR